MQFRFNCGLKFRKLIFRIGSSKDFFQFLLHDKAQKVDKNNLNEISQKILFWAKSPILAQLWPKTTQAYSSGSASRILSKFAA